jgi:hypothetical protein
MLASTVQFSTYGQSPHIPHRQTPGIPGGTTSMRHHRRNQPNPTRTKRSRPARSLRTQQRAYDQPPPTTTFHTHPEGQAVLAATQRSPAELVSVPPLSSTPNTRTHPERGEHHGPSVALDHHNECGGQCSLERR